jgi:oligopeptidase B
MTRRDVLRGTALALVLSAGLARRAIAAAGPVAPETPRHPLHIDQLGRVRIDDYAWLKPSNWKQVWRDPAALDPSILSYLEEENRYCDAVLAPTKDLQDELVREMIARTAPSAEPPPRIDGEWVYFTRYAKGAQHPQYCRRPHGGGAETVLMDVEIRSRGHGYFAVKNASHSPDHKLFAWAEDLTGAEKFRICIKDIESGAIFTGGPESAFGDFAFSPDSQWLFWTWRDENSRPARIYRRRVAGGLDILVYEERDPAYLMQVSLSASRAVLFIRCWNDVTSEVRFITADAVEKTPILIEPRQDGLFYEVADWQGRLVIRTNADGADDFKLMQASFAVPGRANWKPWIECRPGHFIVEVHPFARYFCWIERVEGNPHLMVAAEGGEVGEPIRFDEAGYAIAVEPSDHTADVLRLTFESPRQPKRWIACDLATGHQTVLAQERPSGGYDPANYVVKRLHARARDGALIPVTLLHARMTAIDGCAPLLLTGYGAYGYSFETGFSLPLLSLIDRGWIWAVAHVRGGSEKGSAWFEAARRLRKKTSFTDFIACAEELVRSRHTSPKRIVAYGFSAGGLLVGAALNLRPDLFGAVIGQAPFVDMLNTMSDASHPLVPLTRPTWGDPLSDPEAYDYIAGYSPYENVGARPYPAVLATTALGDDRVGYWEPAKWIAALRARSTSGKPMLLHTDMAGGHHGAAGRFEEYAQIARTYAFAMDALVLPAKTGTHAA